MRDGWLPSDARVHCARPMGRVECLCHKRNMIARRTFIRSASIAAIASAASEVSVSLQKRTGTMHNIVVTPLAYVTDNGVTLDAIARLGAGARGVAVIRPTITDAELKKLADGGVRGIRFSLTDPKNAPTSIEMIE